MSRPPFEVADIIRSAGDAFREQYGNSLTWPQHKVLDAIVRCRTAALGGHRDQCLSCGREAVTKGGDRQDVPHAARLQIFRHKFMGYVLSVTAVSHPAYTNGSKSWAACGSPAPHSFEQLGHLSAVVFH
jgi:hypothetical protein